ncbi:MAG TPA: amino acid racemase [Pseudorhodoferax sp.]|nr:amino acid racemase [Pseudorhodoferax sp.]
MNKVGIIGGMGPYAGSGYLQCFLEECIALLRAAGLEVTDQRYPPHYVVQHPVPDRTAALLQGPDGYAAVFQDILGQVRALQSLGVSAAAMACNTAHAWHADLQQAVPGVRLVHMAEATAAFLAARSVRSVGLLATAGTLRSGMYARALSAQGIACLEPDARELQTIMTGIYGGVKAGNLGLGRSCFAEALAAMARRTGVAAFLMACTEIPLALDGAAVAPHLALYDPTRISAQQLARLALA